MVAKRQGVNLHSLPALLLWPFLHAREHHKAPQRGGARQFMWAGLRRWRPAIVWRREARCPPGVLMRFPLSKSSSQIRVKMSPNEGRRSSHGWCCSILVGPYAMRYANSSMAHRGDFLESKIMDSPSTVNLRFFPGGTREQSVACAPVLKLAVNCAKCQTDGMTAQVETRPMTNWRARRKVRYWNGLVRVPDQLFQGADDGAHGCRDRPVRSGPQL